MSYFTPTIRYEYAEESSNTSQPPSMYADPPLFKEEVPDESSHYFLHSNSNACFPPFPQSTMVQMTDDENLSPSVAEFSPFGMGDTSHEFNHPTNCQPTPSSVDYYFWQSDDASSSSVDGEEKRRLMGAQFCETKQIRQNDSDQNEAQRRHSDQQEQRGISDSAQVVHSKCQQRRPFGKISGTVPLVPAQRGNDVTVPPVTERLTMEMETKRVPLQSMENATMRRSRNNSGCFHPADNGHHLISKMEPIGHSESIPPKQRLGPPAHWRVEETEKRQKRSVKRASFSKSITYQIDEQGRQVVVVTGNDAYRAQDDDDERADGVSEREGPPVARNGFVKPAYSYSCLIGLSLKNSDTGELTVSEIYAFLCHHFPYFREAPSGWKNSVRHNLSLNKCFQKIEVETPGSHGRKSCLWRMNPQKCAKMDQELRKWRDRDERRILDAMEMPQNLDALQNGTMGMPPNMKPRRFSIALPADECNHQFSFHSSSAPLEFVHRSADSSTSKRTPPLQCPADESPSLVTLPPLPLVQQRSAVDGQCLRLVPNVSSTVSCDRQRHSVHAQAVRKLENLLQQKQISSESVPDEAAGYFGGFTLIGGPSGSGGKRRRSSDNELI